MAALRIVYVFALMFLGEILSLIFSAGVHAQGCPQDWAQHGSSCYYRGKDEKTCTEADSYCRSLDSLLAVIDSADEQDFIDDTFLSNGQSIWLGCKEEIKDKWICIAEKDTTKSMEYTNWNPGSPFHVEWLGCVTAYSDYNRKWFDNSCTSSFYPLCERRVVAINMVDNKNTCPQFCHSHKYCAQN